MFSLDCIFGLGEEFVTFSLGLYKANIHNVSLHLIFGHSLVSFCCSLILEDSTSLVDSLSMNIALWLNIMRCTLDVTKVISLYLYTQIWTEYQRMNNMKLLKKVLIFHKLT